MGGRGGSGGSAGSYTGLGGEHGGGGSTSSGVGGNGVVRIIWPGTTRYYPSTCTGTL
jgi:hypothetical protein